MATEQTLRVRVIGDTAQASASLRGFSRDAEAMQSGFGRQASRFGVHSNEIKKHIKGIRRVARDSFGAFGGVAGSLGQAGLAGSELGVVLSAIPFGPVAGAALGLAAVIWKLHDSETAAEAQAKRLAAAHAAVGAAVQNQRAASVAQTQASVDILKAQKDQEDAVKKLAAARTHLDAVEKKHGTNSRAYRDALLKVREAQVAAAATTQRHADAMTAGLAASKKAASSVDGEITALQKRKRALEDAVLGAKTFGIDTEHLTNHQNRLAQVTDQLNSKLDAAAGKHRQAAAKARELAAAVGGATPRARELRDQLNLLAKQEIEKAKKVAALNAIGNAAQGAAGKVASLRNQLLLANAAKIPGVNAAPADRRAGGHEAKERRSIVDVNRPGLSIADRAAADLTGGSLDDSLQDKGARASGEAAAAAGGATNPDNIRLQGELAVTKRQITENKARQRIVSSALRRVRGQIAKKLGTRDRLFASLRRTHDKKKREAIQKKIDDVRSVLSSLYDDERGLISEAASLAAEASELGFDANALVSEIASTPAVLPAGSVAAGPSAADVEAALAGTTPGTADDLTAAQHQLSDANAALAAAQAGGDAQAIIDAANKVTSLTQTVAGLSSNGVTASAAPGGLPAGTPSAGSPISGGVVLNVFPQGAAGDDPRALMAAAWWEMRKVTVGI